MNLQSSNSELLSATSRLLNSDKRWRRGVRFVARPIISSTIGYSPEAEAALNAVDLSSAGTEISATDFDTASAQIVEAWRGLLIDTDSLAARAELARILIGDGPEEALARIQASQIVGMHPTTAAGVAPSDQDIERWRQQINGLYRVRGMPRRAEQLVPYAAAADVNYPLGEMPELRDRIIATFVSVRGMRNRTARLRLPNAIEAAITPHHDRPEVRELTTYASQLISPDIVREADDYDRLVVATVTTLIDVVAAHFDDLGQLEALDTSGSRSEQFAQHRDSVTRSARAAIDEIGLVVAPGPVGRGDFARPDGGDAEAPDVASDAVPAAQIRADSASQDFRIQVCGHLLSFATQLGNDLGRLAASEAGRRIVEVSNNFSDLLVFPFKERLTQADEPARPESGALSFRGASASDVVARHRDLDYALTTGRGIQDIDNAHTLSNMLGGH